MLPKLPFAAVGGRALGVGIFEGTDEIDWQFYVADDKQAYQCPPCDFGGRGFPGCDVSNRHNRSQQEAVTTEQKFELGRPELRQFKLTGYLCLDISQHRGGEEACTTASPRVRDSAAYPQEMTTPMIQ